VFGGEWEDYHENSVHSRIVNDCRRRSWWRGHSRSSRSKPKAYVISETEAVDAAAQAAYTPLVRAALNAAGGRSLRTAGGKVVHLEGAASPKRVGLVEWDSLEQAEAFYKSKAYNEAQKVIRRYAVEVMN
jgi:uncharacterized protein (DUF1330 family)